MLKLLVGRWAARGCAAAIVFASPLVAPGTGSASESDQLIVVSALDSSDTTATLTAYERDADGDWAAVLGPVPAFVGEQGMGAGRDNVPRTPVGTFEFDVAFGRDPDPGTALPYTQVTDRDWWDAYPESPTYNTMVHRTSSPGPGSENLYDSGPSYDYAVNIAHNPARVPGKAAGIFLHISNGQPTLGCVAIDKASMRRILRWLDPAEHPLITIGVDVGDRFAEQ